MSPTPASEVFDTFRIELDAGANPVFRGGERITGNVKIKLKKEVVIQVIRIQFKGRAVQKESKKGRDVEKIIFDKDFVLLERPPGKIEAGHFTWKADFEYSLPFQYILPLGCPSSFESPDGFIRYFTRLTLEISDSKSVYVAKKHFSVYDLDTASAIDPRYQEPYTYRHTFSSGGCCCKKHVYLEFIMPKRAFYAGEDIEGKMIVDNIADERIANDIQYNIVQRIVKPEINDEDALKYPARVIKSAKIDGSDVEKRKNQIVINSLLIPAAAPISLPNAVAFATLPRDKTSPQLSPDDQASKLFEHESIISQSRKEPIFRVHYAVQLLIGKFIVEIPIVLRPVESEDVRNLLKQKESNNVQLVDAQVAHQNPKQFVEADENNMIFVDPPVDYVPVVPVYKTRPVDENTYTWPSLGTYGPNEKLIWHPEKKLTKDQKSEQIRAKKQKAAEEKEAKKQAKLEARKSKKSDKELLIVTKEPEANSMSVNVESIVVESQVIPASSQPLVDEPTISKEPELEVSEPIVVEIPKKKTRAEIRREKVEAERAEKQRKKEEQFALKQQKEAKKRELEQSKIDAANAKRAQKEEQKRLKAEEAERKKQAKLEAKTKKTEKEPLIEAGPSGDIIETTTFIKETIVEQHGNAEPNVSITVTEQRNGEEIITTTITGHQELLDMAGDILEPQPITDEIVFVSNGHHPQVKHVNGHHEETQENGQVDGEIEPNGHVTESDDIVALKKRHADTSNQLPTEA